MHIKLLVNLTVLAYFNFAHWFFVEEMFLGSFIEKFFNKNWKSHKGKRNKKSGLSRLLSKGLNKS